MPVYKDKDKGTWYASFYYRDWAGKNRKKKKEGFKRQADAKAFERNFILQQTGSPDMTFAALVELYNTDCKPRVRETTYYGKVQMINKHIIPTFGDMELNSINATTIRNWQTEMLQSEYSLTYLKTLHNQVSAIFNFAVKYYGLKENPAAKCGAMGKKSADAMKFWTQEQFKLFDDAVSNKLTSHVVFNTLFWTGIRAGELLALTESDIDGGTLKIRKSYARLNKKDIVNEPKTPKSKRDILMPPFLTAMLQDYIDKLPVRDENERIFPVTKNYLTHEMKRGCQESGVPKIRIHDLRHSHASLLIEMGFSPLLIAERLGHEDIKTTLQTYSHLYPNKQSELAQELEKIRI